METTVYSRLQQTPEEYEHMVMNIWFSWCSEKAQNQKTLQKLLTCPPLFIWWQRELQKFEQRFMEDTEDYKNAMYKVEAKKLYAEYIIEIFKRYSKPLIKKATE